ncbi:CAZyme family CE10 [Penicillium brevicompactum]
MADPYTKLLNLLSKFDDPGKFGSFKVFKTSYKSSNDDLFRIDADVLIPWALLSSQGKSKCPVMVRIHGGFLVTGSSSYPPWFANWTLEYAISKSAIIVAPNYRLLPEASGKDMMEDMDDFWRWLRSPLFTGIINNASSGCLSPDINRILLEKGGYLAMHLALSYPSEIRAIVGAYPILDVESRFYTEAYPKPIIGVPNIPVEVLEAHLSNMRTTHSPTVVTAADPPDRLELAFSVFQNGRFVELLGADNVDLFPMKRVKALAAAGRLRLPPTFIFHGRQDSAVPCEGSQRFVDLVREKLPDASINFHVLDGDHGVDFEATLATDWLHQGLSMITSAWDGSMKADSNL